MSALDQLLGESAPMTRLRTQIQRVATTPLPVLITGETGSGKEVVARALHEESGRSGLFVPVDCGALSDSLIESELFGHERGAFTGAHQRREGLISAARGGTFFLDEIGELRLDTQSRLLRILESGVYRRIGATVEAQADIRVVAATWRDLRQRVREGAFREDLYHRLTIIELPLPALRLRGADVLLLLRQFMEQQADSVGRQPPRVEGEVARHLQDWPWPGNVRELKNTAAYLVAMTPGSRVRYDDLPVNLRRSRPDAPVRDSGVEIRIELPYMEARREYLDQFQERYVMAQLEEHDGNVSAAARASEMDRRSIQRILARVRGSS
jgi:DNA-binding NtrC family response regulator